MFAGEKFEATITNGKLMTIDGYLTKQGNQKSWKLRESNSNIIIICDFDSDDRGYRGTHRLISMAIIQAWFMDDSQKDPQLPHHRNPHEFVSPDHLADLGVLHWKLNPDNYEEDEELEHIRATRGYNYMDLLDLCPEKVENYEQKLKNFYTEHIHADEEIRYCLEGSGYFDVRNKDDRWIRIWMKPGDLIILPAGIYHRFTLDTSNYIKLMRLFVGEPVWTAFNRPQEEHPARRKYIGNFGQKFGMALEAH